MVLSSQDSLCSILLNWADKASIIHLRDTWDYCHHPGYQPATEPRIVPINI